jgi:hypothetical protein
MSASFSQMGMDFQNSKIETALNGNRKIPASGILKVGTYGVMIYVYLLPGVQLKSGPYFNIRNLFTKIYTMLYRTTNLYLQ